MTADDGTVSEIVQTITPEEILDNASLSLTLEEVLETCFNGGADQITSFDVQVSALNESGCESQVLNGSMTLYAAPEPTAIFEALCEGACAAPINVNADGGLDFQWFLDADSCDGVDETPCGHREWGLSNTLPVGFEWQWFCDCVHRQRPGVLRRDMHLDHRHAIATILTLPTVEDSLLQCTSPWCAMNLRWCLSQICKSPRKERCVTTWTSSRSRHSIATISTSEVAEEPCLDCPATS